MVKRDETSVESGENVAAGSLSVQSCTSGCVFVVGGHS